MPKSYSLYIPHYRAIIALYLGGVPFISIGDDNLPLISDILAEFGFNNINYVSFFLDLEKTGMFDHFKQDIEQNTKIYKHNAKMSFLSKEKQEFRTYIFDNEVFDTDYIRNCAIEFVCRAHKIKRVSKKISVSRVIDLLEDINARVMIETGIMKNIPVDKITSVYEKSNIDFDIKISSKVIVAYAKMFWDCSSSSLRRSGCSLNDLWNYLSLDRHDIIYSMHKKLIFSSRESFLMVNGIIEDDHRLRVSKKLYGRTSEIILENLDKNIPTRLDILDIHKHSDTSITTLTREGVDPDKYKNEIERIYERLDVVRSQRLTLDQLKDAAMSGNIPTGLEENDSPLFGEKEKL